MGTKWAQDGHGAEIKTPARMQAFDFMVAGTGFEPVTFGL